MRKLLRLSGVLWGVWLGSTACAEGEGKGPAGTVPQSVVKIFATRRDPDLYRPWLKGEPEEVTGTGVVIEGNRILTNAHVVNRASRLFVRGEQSADKVAATVESLGADIDLAVLKVETPGFFEGRPPLARVSGLPSIKDAVLLYGYPTGGEGLSTTKGIVSRVEYEEYYYWTKGLRVQVDAAINPGNSGGPALIDDKVVGIVMSRLEDSDNIGYLIPSEEIELFLKDVADGTYDGKPAFWESTQDLENPALRARMKLGKDVSGVMIWELNRPEEPNPLKPWDVIVAIGDHPIDNSGMVRVNDHLRLGFRYFVQKEARDGTVPLGIVRDGRRLTVNAPVSSKYDGVIPFLEGRYPSYFVWGPMVFSPLTEDFIHQFDQRGMAENWFAYLGYHHSPMMTRRSERAKFPGEELVVVTSAFLSHPIAKGYTSPFAQVVREVNGVPIRNLRHLAETLRDTTDDHVAISFVEKGMEVVVFDRKEILEASRQILDENSIRQAYSDDLRSVWAKSKENAEEEAETR